MMCKFLLALGLCLCLGQLGEGAVDLEDMEDCLAYYQFLREINVDNVMDRVKAAVEGDSRSRSFHLLKFYERHRSDIEIVSNHHISTVMDAFWKLEECVESHDLSRDCREIVQRDRCNIQRGYIITKERFDSKVAQALQTPGFDAVPGLVQDVQTLKAMVTEMDFDSDVTDVQTFEAFVKNAHELAIFYKVVSFAEGMVNRGTPERLQQEQ